MDELIIKEHNFCSAKSKIKEFSSRGLASSYLSKVEVKTGIFGWRDHKVTGEEMNNLAGQIQRSFININSTIKEIVSEFGEVYNAFETLDKDYIQSILLSIKSAQQASVEAKQAHVDISRTIDALQMAVQKLTEFKIYVNKELDSIRQSDKNKVSLPCELQELEIMSAQLQKLMIDYVTIMNEKTKNKMRIHLAMILGVVAVIISIGHLFLDFFYVL